MSEKKPYDLIDEYIIKFKNGEDSAFDYIYYSTINIVQITIYSIVKEKTNLDDLSQDVYMKVLEKLNSYKIGTNFYAWIATIAKNISINHYNHYKKEDLIDPLEQMYRIDISGEKSIALLAVSYLEGALKAVFINKIFLGLKCSDIDRILSLKPRQSEYLYKKALAIVKESI